MRKRLWYPNIQTIINNNKKVLKIFKATKADHHQILNRNKLIPIIKEAKVFNGDIEDKASILLRGINHAHAFGSGNKRTAYFTANQFIYKNKGFLLAKKREKQRDFSIKVREGKVEDKEIADWLR